MRLAVLLALAAGSASAQSLHQVQESSQRGSGSKSEATATPGPGLESGKADVQGRTDRGPIGVTGLEGSGTAHAWALARANDQARGANAKGSFLRPADSPAQIELNPRVMGSGADYGAFPMGGQNYFDGHATNGGVSAPGSPGGAATKGSAGKSER